MLYPIGIQDFEKIRKDGFVYVDKTKQIYNLFHGSGSYFFLSRPRRFGKSLLVSTMEAYFSGRKELFEGLAIGELEKDWIQYPVLRFDLGGKSYARTEDLEDYLDKQLSLLEERHSVSRTYDSPDLRFQNLIEAAHARTGRPAVILVDEYDKPIVDNLSNPELADVFRTQLQGFYSVMKSKDAFLKFGFLTGVTKLGQMSVFSGLNNLVDLSLDARYADICGISEAELRAVFPESVRELADAGGLSEEACYQKLALWYDGYHFHPRAVGVYNPFSLLNTFNKLEFYKYWFATGTPSFLVRYLAKSNFQLEDVNGISVSSSMLSGVNAIRPHPITLLYQSGYLTIRSYNESRDRYTLVYPNKEVENGFLESLAEYFTPAQTSNSSLSVDKFVDDITSGNVEMLMRRFSAFFADMDYQIQGDAELYFQNTMYVMLRLMGQQVQVERHTSNGRIDALIQTDRFVYILELKRDKDPQDALDQIAEKGYDWPFAADARKVFRIGATFSTTPARSSASAPPSPPPPAAWKGGRWIPAPPGPDRPAPICHAAPNAPPRGTTLISTNWWKQVSIIRYARRIFLTVPSPFPQGICAGRAVPWVCPRPRPDSRWPAWRKPHVPASRGRLRGVCRGRSPRSTYSPDPCPWP